MMKERWNAYEVTGILFFILIYVLIAWVQFWFKA